MSQIELMEGLVRLLSMYSIWGEQMTTIIIKKE